MPPAPIVRPRTALTTPIWNPDAAANWSLPFSPAFGSFLHMRNWHVLGEPAKARAAFLWFIASLAMLVLSLVLVLALPESAEKSIGIRAANLLFLGTWYFSFARSQMSFVKRNFGDEYARKKWGAPIGIALACVVVYGGVAFAVGFLYELLRQ